MKTIKLIISVIFTLIRVRLARNDTFLQLDSVDANAQELDHDGIYVRTNVSTSLSIAYPILSSLAQLPLMEVLLRSQGYQEQ